jgi:hypothetical protein
MSKSGKAPHSADFRWLEADQKLTKSGLAAPEGISRQKPTFVIIISIESSLIMLDSFENIYSNVRSPYLVGWVAVLCGRKQFNDWLKQ